MNKKILLSLIIFTVMIFAAPAFAQNQQNIALKAGYNFVSFTVIPAVTPQQLKTQYPSIEDIFFYHAYSGGFISLNEGTLVTLSAGKGYAIKSLQDITITVSGSLPGACGAIALVPEYNLVGFSKVPETITFGQLMARYSAIKGVYKWNFNAGVFVQVLRDGGGNIVLVDGVDPTITAGESYFINMQSQCDLSYDQAQIAITGDNVTSTNISSMSVVNGKLTLNFTGAALPQALSISDFSVNVSINSSPYNWVIPVSVTRKSDTSAELILPLIQTSTTIDQLVAYKVAYLTNNPVFAPTFTIVKNTSGKVEAPVFSVPGGNYNTMQILTLTCPTPDAEIYCSIDGSEPVPYYGYKYYPGVFGPFVLLKNKTVKAIAVKRGMENSDVVTATYTMDIPPVVEINFRNDILMPHLSNRTSYQLLNAANNFQPLCEELIGVYNPVFRFGLTENIIVPLLVTKYDGKTIGLRLLQKMPAASEMTARGIAKINLKFISAVYNHFTADALLAIERNAFAQNLTVPSNDEIVYIDYDFKYYSEANILTQGIAKAADTLTQILISDYISPEVKELIQPSFDFTISAFLTSFVTAVKHPQVKLFLNSYSHLFRSVTVNSVVIDENTTVLPGDLLDVSITAATANNGSINVTFSKVLNGFSLGQDVIFKLNGVVVPIGLSIQIPMPMPSNSFQFSFTPITPTDTTQNIPFEISYLGCTPFTSTLVVPPRSDVQFINATNGDITVTFFSAPSFAPAMADFLLKLNGTVHTLSAVMPLNATSYRLIFPQVTQTAASQTINVELSYKGGPFHTSFFIVPIGSVSIPAIDLSAIIFDTASKKLSWTIPSGLPKPFYVSSCELTNNQGGMFSNSMIPMGTNFVDLPTGGTWPTATSFNVRLKLIMADTQIDLHDPAKSITGPETLKTFTLEGMPLSSIVNVSATNGMLNVFFNVNPSPIAISADFVIMQSIDGGSETIVPAIVVNNLIPMIGLNIPMIPAATTAQTVSYRVSYKGGPFVASSTFSVPATTPSLLAPVMTPVSGTAATSVTLVTSTPGAAIYYKIVGQADTPTAQDIFSTGSVYNGPISLTEGVGIKIASVSAINGVFSEVVYGAYNVTPPAPELGK